MYERPHAPKCQVVYVDESFKQLVGDVRAPLFRCRRKETVRGTLSVNGGEATAEVTLAPGEMKTFGRLELFRALRKGDRVEVSLVGFRDAAQYEIAEEKLEVPVEP